MSISYTRISALIFLLFFIIYSYLAGEIKVFVFDENADFNARTFPKLISYIGIIFSFLTLVLSRSQDEPLGQYEWLKVFVLFVLLCSVLIKRPFDTSIKCSGTSTLINTPLSGSSDGWSLFGHQILEPIP